MGSGNGGVYTYDWTVNHVHADDVAQAFERTVERGNEVAGQSFHITSDQALTLRGFDSSVAHWPGCEPRLSFVPFEEFAESADLEHAPWRRFEKHWLHKTAELISAKMRASKSS